MKPEKRLAVHAELVKTITDAALAALAAGMTRADVAAAIQRVAELIEQEDD